MHIHMVLRPRYQRLLWRVYLLISSGGLFDGNTCSLHGRHSTERRPTFQPRATRPRAVFDLSPSPPESCVQPFCHLRPSTAWSFAQHRPLLPVCPSWPILAPLIHPRSEYGPLRRALSWLRFAHPESISFEPSAVTVRGCPIPWERL